MKATRALAQQEFGDADLGDARRTRRLVEIASAVAMRPRGAVTQVVAGAAAREGAFRFVENDSIDSAAIGAASHEATARRCSSVAEVIVAVDQSTLTLTDRVGKPGFGRTGPRADSRATGGFQVMTALAIRRDQVVEGILGQQWWARYEKSPDYRHDERPRDERESGMWERTIKQAESVMAAAAPNSRAWYQLDRGADSRAVLELAVDASVRITVRSAYNRTLASGHHLHTAMQRQRVRGTFTLQVSTADRSQRKARLLLRSAQVKLRLNAPRGNQRRVVDVSCVYVVEQHARKRHDRLEWWLLTTGPASTFAEALDVVRNYTARWRVEEFHRAWKSGVSNIENSQLRSAAAFKRWATISAAVAARAERLKTISRAEPDRPALSELSPEEIDAAILLSETRRHARGDALTLSQAVALIADIGGYSGKSSGGPPGTRVIQRGLEEVITASRVLRAVARQK